MQALSAGRAMIAPRAIDLRRFIRPRGRAAAGAMVRWYFTPVPYLVRLRIAELELVGRVPDKRLETGGGAAVPKRASKRERLQW